MTEAELEDVQLAKKESDKKKSTRGIKDGMRKARVGLERAKTETELVVTKAKDKGITVTKVLADSLPDAEFLVFSLLVTTLFTRAQEAHLQSFCKNEGSLTWMLILVCACATVTLKYADTGDCLQTLRAAVIYFTIHLTIYYAPVGCITDAFFQQPAGSLVYNGRMKTMAIIQTAVLVLVSGLYLFMIVGKRFPRFRAPSPSKKRGTTDNDSYTNNA